MTKTCTTYELLCAAEAADEAYDAADYLSEVAFGKAVRANATFGQLTRAAAVCSTHQVLCEAAAADKAQAEAEATATGDAAEVAYGKALEANAAYGKAVRAYAGEDLN